MFTEKINSLLNDHITTEKRKRERESWTISHITGIKMSLSDFPCSAFRILSSFIGGGKVMQNPNGNHWSRQKIFILSRVCIKSGFKAHFAEIRRCRNRLSDVVNFLQNKYTFLSQPTLNFIELENLFKMFSFVLFSLLIPSAVAKKYWHEFPHWFLLFRFTAFCSDSLEGWNWRRFSFILDADIKSSLVATQPERKIIARKLR